MLSFGIQIYYLPDTNNSIKSHFCSWYCKLWLSYNIIQSLQQLPSNPYANPL